MSRPARGRPAATFVLVHGAWQGAWAWERLLPHLEAAGFAAVAVDLPGNGTDATPPGAVDTYLYGRHVAAIADALDGPVVLVGHSMGGTAVAQACEYMARPPALAVYLAAFLLRDGESVMDFYAANLQPWMRGAHARVTHSADGLLSSIDPRSAIEVFYNTCAPSDAAIAASRLTAQPEGGRRTRLQLSAARFGRVKRIYVETLRDRSVFVELQRAMHGASACAEVHALDTDHAPQLSAPSQLARLLVDCVVRQLGPGTELAAIA
ncbi:MAG: alpha/beta fold hydrolase [Alphaproteobacteria bacterium]